MRRLLPAVACSALALACQRTEAPEPTDAPKASASAIPEPSTASEAKAPPVAPVDHHGLAWFEDAADAAQAEAVRTGKPLLVDLWAPWCHTCLSMKNFVLTRDKLGELSTDFVYLALNSERAQNA